MKASRAVAAAALVVACAGSEAPEPTPARPAAALLAELLERGDRRSGTDALAAAATFCLDELRGAGLAPWTQRYRFPRHEGIEHVAEVLAPDGAVRSLESFPIFYTAPTTASAVADLAGAIVGDVRARVADAAGAFLVSDHTRFREDLDAALAGGALGVLVDTDRRPLYAGRGVFAAGIAPRWEPFPLPAAVVDGAAALAAEGATVRLRSRSRIVEGEGRNVVARIAGRAPGWVLLTAHLDAWFAGAVDDGSGVAAALVAARRLRERAGELERGVLVLLADGEEIGLLGSSVFLRRLGELGVADEDVDAVVELDMVSSLGAYGGRPPERAEPFPRFLVTTPGLDAEARALDAALPGADLPLPVGLAEAVVGLRTDARWLFHRGVPGLFVNVLTAWYHSPRDTAAWVDPDDLERVAEATVEAVLSLSRRGELPVSPHIPLGLALERVGERVAITVTVGAGAPTGTTPRVLVHSDLGLVDVPVVTRVPGAEPPRFTAASTVASDRPVEVLATASAAGRGGDVWAADPP